MPDSKAAFRQVGRTEKLSSMNQTRSADQSFVAGGGEIGALTRAHDWRRTPFGALEEWPEVLRSTDAAGSLGRILEFLGADVRLAGDGIEALQQFETYDPQVVVLDIGMPGMDGYEVARRIRGRFPQRRAALVALTGWGQEEDRRKARDAGFDHHLVKPAEIAALQKLLAAL